MGKVIVVRELQDPNLELETFGPSPDDYASSPTGMPLVEEEIADRAQIVIEEDVSHLFRFRIRPPVLILLFAAYRFRPFTNLANSHTNPTLPFLIPPPTQQRPHR